MEKTCPLIFDIECERITECQVPRRIKQCKHLVVEVDSAKVFMGNPVRTCTVLCTRTNRPFTEDELEFVIKCTREHFENRTCPRAHEPD